MIPLHEALKASTFFTHMSCGRGDNEPTYAKFLINLLAAAPATARCFTLKGESPFLIALKYRAPSAALERIAKEAQRDAKKKAASSAALAERKY